ncbi:MAG: DUF5723 family protein [Bacteroidota bacterium]
MKLKQHLISFLFFSVLSFSVMAQQNLTMYNITSLQQTQVHANPAFTPTAKINIAIAPLFPPFPIPSAYINISNSGFKLSDLVKQDSDGKTYYDFDNMISKTKKNNYLTTALHIDLLTFGFRIKKKNYLSFNVSNKMDLRMRYPQDFLNVLINGNGADATIGQEQKFNFGVDMMHYTDVSVGFSREVIEKKLTLGVKVKYLMGQENIYTKKSDVSLTTGAQNFDLTAKSDIAIYTSGLDTNSRSQQNFSPMRYFFNTKNSGVGIDLGANYILNNKWSVSASVLDLGFIEWKEATKNYVSANPGSSVTFSGVNLKDFINDSTTLAESFNKTIDSIAEQFKIEENVNTYRTNLSTKIYLGGSYHINEKNFASLLLYGQFYDKKIHPAASLSFNTTVGRWLNASISYSMLNRSYNNVGLGLVLNPGWFQWYVISDNVLGVLVMDKYNKAYVPAYTKNINVRVGFNLTIGKKMKDKDKDGIADKKDLCPETFGLESLQGCPDKDGDGIKDLDDKCPDIAGLKELNGCPDKDADGIMDSEDACPEDKGLPAFKGCPDKDGDNIMDKEDACPEEAGLIDFNGCPDRDNDLTPDKDDACPDVKGPKEFKGCPDKDGDTVLDKDDDCPEIIGAVDNKGCPWPDTDGDGVVDREDDCPSLAGLKELRGCQPAPVLKAEEQKILEKAFSSLEFATGKDIIKPVSFKSLNELAGLMKQHADDWTLRLSGHTDNQGDAAKNLLLSEKRAKAVKKYLVTKGAKADKISTEWFGPNMPIADNATETGRQKNRRVEMKVEFKSK